MGKALAKEVLGAALWLLSIAICITVIANTKDWLETSQVGMTPLRQ